MTTEDKTPDTTANETAATNQTSEATPAPRSGDGSPKPLTERRPARGGKVPVDEIAAGIAAAGKQMSTKLRELLMGTVLVKIVDRSKAFLFNPLVGGFTLTEFGGAEARSASGDCMISLSETSLQRMWNGDLNPQIAMLSDKVTISGKAELAVYFFNLVSPH